MQLSREWSVLAIAVLQINQSRGFQLQRDFEPSGNDDRCPISTKSAVSSLPRSTNRDPGTRFILLELCLLAHY
jgi:hypothetical protein